MIVVIYLAAIAIANLIASSPHGLELSVLNAFVLIGLDITLRDTLHQRWHGQNLRRNMLALLIAGGVVSFLVNPSALRIAVASSLSFMAAMSCDAMVYERLFKHPRLIKINGSNVASAIVDSALFPILAFGALPLWLFASQLAIKILGGSMWSIILNARQSRVALSVR